MQIGITVKKKWILCVYIIVLLIFVKQAFNCIYNEWVIMKYNRQDYSMDVSALQILNVFQPYIPHYNNGNIYYREEAYDMAIEEYSTALRKHPPKYKECSIRINLALAMLGLLDEDYDAPDKREDSIALLKEARAVLLEDDCATEVGDGHSETAEKLKEEIDRLLRELEEQSETSTEPEDSNTDTGQEQEAELENNIREQLQGNQSEAYQDREAELQFIEEFEMDFNFDYGDAIW